MSKPLNNNEFPEVSWSDSPEGGEGTEILPQVKGYEIVKKLGDGGMGVVYLAEQKEPIKRQVALKIIKPGMDSAKVIARFEAERQTLASLDHPNIARIFEAGTTQLSRPYFAMEYVKGLRITDYCDLKRLDIEERLKLFIQVCQAIQHAHQKGFIHRDIKPSNVLISIQDDQAIPKIIDFGVAKALSQQMTERTMFTEEGQLIGTPEYMSPEQVGMGQEYLDIRSDIYSLGVLLYELLTGKLPFDREILRQAAFVEIVKIIQEQDPPRPSAHISSLGEKAKAVAEKRCTKIVNLVRCLKNELEWIPLKAMRKEPDHRYRTASELADDIQNYLEDTPLIAGPVSATYKLKKYIRRHRALVTSIFAIILIFASASTVTMFSHLQARSSHLQAREAEKRAVDEATRAKEEAEQNRRLLYFHNIKLAEAEYRQDNLSQSRQQLSFCPVDLRDWEWYRLWLLAIQEKYSFRFSRHSVRPSFSFSQDGQRVFVFTWQDARIWDLTTAVEIKLSNKNVRTAAFSPDGIHVALVISPNRIKICDVTTGDEVWSVNQKDMPQINSIGFSPDGRYVISGRGYISVWNIESGKKVILEPPHRIECVAFSRDCRYIISGHEDGNLTFREAESASIIWKTKIKYSGRRVIAIALSPDGQRVVALHDDNNVMLWHIGTETAFKSVSVQGDIDRWFNNVVMYSPDGKFVAIRVKDVVSLLDVNTGEILITFAHAARSSGAIRFAPDNRLLALELHGNNVRLWDVGTNKKVAVLRGHEGAVTSATISSDCRYVVSFDNTNVIKVWDLTTIISRNVTTTIVGADAMRGPGINSISYSPDGEYLATASSDGTVGLWNPTSGKKLLTLKGHKNQVNSISFSPDGQRIVSGSSDKTVIVWNVKTGERLMNLEGHEDAVLCVAYSPNGKYIASGGSDKRLILWNAEHGIELKGFANLGHRYGVNCIDFSPDGTKIVSGHNSRMIRLWDVESRQELQEISSRESYCVNSIAFSPDGSHIAAAYGMPRAKYSVSGDKAVVRVWDVGTGKELTVLRKHSDKVTSVAFSPNGKRIVSAGQDGVVKIWDPLSGTEVMTLREHQQPLSSVTFSPNGKSIVSADVGGVIKVWNSASGNDVLAKEIGKEH